MPLMSRLRVSLMLFAVVLQLLLPLDGFAHAAMTDMADAHPQMAQAGTPSAHCAGHSAGKRLQSRAHNCDCGSAGSIAAVLPASEPAARLGGIDPVPLPMNAGTVHAARSADLLRPPIALLA